MSAVTEETDKLPTEIDSLCRPLFLNLKKKTFCTWPFTTVLLPGFNCLYQRQIYCDYQTVFSPCFLTSSMNPVCPVAPKCKQCDVAVFWRPLRGEQKAEWQKSSTLLFQAGFTWRLVHISMTTAFYQLCFFLWAHIAHSFPLIPLLFVLPFLSDETFLLI